MESSAQTALEWAIGIMATAIFAVIGWVFNYLNGRVSSLEIDVSDRFDQASKERSEIERRLRGETAKVSEVNAEFRERILREMATRSDIENVSQKVDNLGGRLENKIQAREDAIMAAISRVEAQIRQSQGRNTGPG